MKIPVGREPGLDGGREAGTSGRLGDGVPCPGQGGAGTELTRRWVPKLVFSVVEQSLGPALPRASRKPISLPSGLLRTIRRSQESALVWDHADLAPHSTILCHTGPIHPSVY